MVTRRLVFLSCPLVIFWLCFEGWIISSADAQDTFSLNFVFEEGECSGSQPTVRVSTRLGRSGSISGVYTLWIPLSGNCSAAQNLSFSLPTTLGGVAFGSLDSRRYQLRIDLSPADHCHCLTVDSATGVIGNIILNQWRDGSFWCGSNITQLCSSSSDNTTFYSALMRQNGSLSECDESTDVSLSISNVQIPVVRACRALSTIKCAADGDWMETTRCGISRLHTDSKSCSLPDTNVTIRVCHCNGDWGPVHCHPSLQLVEELLESSLPEDSLMILSQLLPNTTTITQRLDLLMRAVQQQLNTTQGITDTFLQLFLNIVEDLPNKANVSDSSFLSLLDNVALNLRLNRTVSSKNDLIRVRIREVFPGSGRVTGIQVDNNYITLPGEIFKDITESVFTASYYFENISNLLPEGAQEPVSSVISSALNCNIGCKTINITENVTIFFDLSLNTTNNTKCVFANMQTRVGADFWNDSGCSTIHFENGSVMCSCNHLTQFGVLIPGPDTSPQTDIQSIVLSVLVPISLVFLLATIITFVLQRSLWNMRNYIHCMLCGSMFTAQLTYIVGINRNENEAVCIAIAVLQHYLILVMCMWMLMEGVVLYVKLFKVFITHHKRYIAFFTIASYGIPLLYMILVVPLGFLANTEHIIGSHYGRRDANGRVFRCWLRYDTYYIWALVAPAFLIIFVNIGFVIMTFAIMCRHLKKIEKRNTTKHLLKVTISLIIITGLSWTSNLIFGHILEIRVMSLIANVFVSCQGIFIFILLVPLSEQVRDAYINWWRKKRPHLHLNKSSVKRFFFPFPSKSLTSSSTKQSNAGVIEDSNLH